MILTSFLFFLSIRSFLRSLQISFLISIIEFSEGFFSVRLCFIKLFQVDLFELVPSYFYFVELNLFV